MRRAGLADVRWLYGGVQLSNPVSLVAVGGPVGHCGLYGTIQPSNAEPYNTPLSNSGLDSAVQLSNRRPYNLRLLDSRVCGEQVEQVRGDRRRDSRPGADAEAQLHWRGGNADR